MENPYVVPAKPERDDYSTLDGDMRHWVGDALIQYTEVTRAFEKQLAMHRAWDEGKAEQAEIVSGLLLVASTVVRYYHRRQDHIVPSHQIDSLEQLIAKAKGK